MRLKNQFFSQSFRAPTNHRCKKITKLIDSHLITALSEKGFPFMLPLGNLVLKNIESVFSDESAFSNIDMVCLPTAMKTEILEKGQELGDTFRSKIMHLTNSLSDHHVISSPETLFIELGKKDQISYNQLPIRQSYFNNLHRQKSNTKGTIHPQQIKIFGGVTISEPEQSNDEIEIIRHVIETSFQKMNLPFHREDKYNGFEHEYFYICTPPNEGDNLRLPGVNIASCSKAYSLGMIYEYPMTNSFRLRFRGKNNKNKKPALISYGFSTHRILHCALHKFHDEIGFNLPETIRPFHVFIIPCGANNINEGEEIYDILRRSIIQTKNGSTSLMNRICLDARLTISVDERHRFASYIGTKLSIIVKNNTYKVLDRNKNKLTTKVNQKDLVEWILINI